MADYEDERETAGEETEEQARKLRRARKLFEDAVDHCKDAHAEAHRAERFYHNTMCEGQWESEDLAYLRDQLRPAFSFNIVKPKVDTMMGMYLDAQRRPIVMGTGAEDKLLAEVVDAVKDQVWQDARADRLLSRVFKTGTIAGECGVHVEVEPSPKGRGWIQVNLYRVLPFEVHWDISSIEPDRSDARYVFWDRWLDKDEFAEAYPKHSDEWKQMRDSVDAYDADAHSSWGEAGIDSPGPDEMYDADKLNRYYVDRNKNKMRVIRYEYRTFVTKFYATDERTGQRTEVGDDQKERVELAQAMGMPISLEEAKEEVVKVCEFVGSKMLAEYDSAGPFDGFSIIPYTYMIDEETGTAYGFVRNLFDPQMELNKSKSLEIEYLAQSTAPGVTAEEDAITDEDQFSAELRRPGGVAKVKPGKLSTGAVQDRTPTPPSPAIMQRAQGAMELLTEISGIPSSAAFSPAEQAQAGMTVAIRYNKSRQGVQDPFSNFEDCQTEVVRRIVETITRAMPDDQIAAMLGNETRFLFGNGMVAEMEPDPRSGQMVPTNRAQLRNMRGIDWNLELEHTSDNSTLRMLELDMYLQLAAAGFPVDPEVVVEKATASRSTRERLKQYVAKSQQAGAEAAQTESQMAQQNMALMAQLEGSKAAEQARSNRAEEAIKLSKQQTDALLKLAEIWERADEAEKGRLVEMVRMDEQRRMAAMGGA